MPSSNPFDTIVRRDFLQNCGLGLGGIALSALLSNEARSEQTQSNPLMPKPSHHQPKAKAVIQLFMAGGPSQLELFDHKPKLVEMDGQIVPQSYIEGKRFAFLKKDPKLLGTRRKFKQYGESGAELSELLPYTAKMADEIAIIKTMKTDNFNHGPAKLIAQTGYQDFGHPSMGAWTLYGLGTHNRDMPGYVVLQSGNRGPRGGAYLWSNGFLPSIYQGVPLRSQGDPILNLNTPAGFGDNRQRRAMQAISQLNRLRHEATGDDEIATRIANYEMAFRMQSTAPDLIDLSQETQTTLDAYGVTSGKASFAKNCLLARRLVEQGVRFITLYHTDWDHHGGGENLESHLDQRCKETDQPAYALIQDLKQRGLLDDTLVIWGGEFGRTPMGEVRKTIGRDHHIENYTIWCAGGGIKPGQTIGQTDELGFYPQEEKDRVHVHDLQATALHLLGLDHLRLTYKHQGRDFRLTDVGGNVIHQLVS